MGNKIVLDTSILIGLQIQDEAVTHTISRFEHRLLVPRVAANEFIHGSRNQSEQKLNQDFLKNLPIIEINEAISLLSYTLTSKYCLKIKVGIADVLIAATAIHNKLPLWTTNIKHFQPIKGLTLFQP